MPWCRCCCCFQSSALWLPSEVAHSFDREIETDTHRVNHFNGCIILLCAVLSVHTQSIDIWIAGMCTFASKIRWQYVQVKIYRDEWLENKRDRENKKDSTQFNSIQFYLLIFHFWWKANLNTNFHWIKFSAFHFAIRRFSLPTFGVVTLFSRKIAKQLTHHSYMNESKWNWCQAYDSFLCTFHGECKALCEWIWFNLLNCQLQHDLYRGKKGWKKCSL